MKLNLKKQKLSEKESIFLEEIFNRERKTLWFVCLSILRDSNEACDAVQQVFSNIAKKISLLMSFDDYSKVKKYIFVSARNMAFEIIRSKKGKAEKELVGYIEDRNCNVENEVMAHFELEELKKAVENLNPTYGDAFYLRYFMELEYQEIADALSISISAAYHRVSKARVLLRAGKNGDYNG